MSLAEAAEPKQEIIIVRRGHGDGEDGHHGGAWKIAFADFMTAMMAFFLVMWLVNAANEQTKAAVASYFNPIKLIDRNASRKGLEDLGDGPAAPDFTGDAPQQEASKSGQDGSGNPGSSKKQDQDEQAQTQTHPADERLFADPYAVLAEIANETGTMQNVSEKGDGGAQTSGPSTGASGGQSYRDPFAPDFWSQQIATPGAEASAARAKVDGDTAKPGDKVAEIARPNIKAEPPLPSPAKAQPEQMKNVLKETNFTAEKSDNHDTSGETTKTKNTPHSVDMEKGPTAETIKQTTALKQKLAEAFKSGDKIAAGISVEATDKGVVISITDQLDFGMFEIGSALPRRDLVLAMEKIGRIISSQKGSIIIQGHTDARPFRGKNYDNWRLSTARAHAAYYMLVRGGIDERRITEVAGFADRRPKDKANPLSAVNRRIEILLETDG